MHEDNRAIRLGIDVGSTTAKMVLLDENNQAILTRYERHNADATGVVEQFLRAIEKKYSDRRLSVSFTGSVGMGLAERLNIPFVQEVVGAATYVRTLYPQVRSMIDIGGEDAKIVYLKDNEATDLRMNGNCAGGTGAFIDQMAILLGVEVSELDALSARAQQTHPIASRCGVFSKTDIQNLMARNVSRYDIAASIFRAVAVQTITTLSHGCEVTPPILFCGGPLSFIPSLRKAFADYLDLTEEQFILPPQAELIPAYGTALCASHQVEHDISQLLQQVDALAHQPVSSSAPTLPQLFTDEAELDAWTADKQRNNITYADHMPTEVYLGIDSGSTTTKIVAIDMQGRIVYQYYRSNEGDPIRTVTKGLEAWHEQCRLAGVDVTVKGSCSTGYGEDLIKAAFKLDNGAIETIAHYLAARRISPDVSFILDIGGQDMKAIFVEKGVISRMELNEACSSGCGSFIETFARSLGYPVEEFARMACTANYPRDLGTRCTVFMNSKVKQALREGASIGDISAGLAYSVVKNCLYKVLKLRDAAVLGEHIVVQGGTMRNNAVVRAFEQLTGQKVHRSSCPELMGAYGCALYALNAVEQHDVSLPDLIQAAKYTRRNSRCSGCENHCYMQRYKFENGNQYVSGNKCERIFSNRGADRQTGENSYPLKYNLLFNRNAAPPPNAPTVGIPRCLNMYEEYPFWHTLFTEAGLEVVLSSPSTFLRYEAHVHAVMSDNICFPAKIVHSHIDDLLSRKVDRIFMPYVVFAKGDGKHEDNSFNCPIVTGYSDVIRNVTEMKIPLDSPAISFKRQDNLKKACTEYLLSIGIDRALIPLAFQRAVKEQERYEQQLVALNRNIYDRSREQDEITIVLAGRPYHADPLIQHKLGEMIASLGVNVVSDDLVRGDHSIQVDESHMVQQWAYVNRILKAATWVADRDERVHFVQMTSFGCGPDAFLTDEVRDILNRKGKSLTLLKIDDINNIGSIKLRVRSLVDSLKYNQRGEQLHAAQPFVTTRKFQRADRKRTILVPFFTGFVSPLIPAAFEVAGYHFETLPVSDTESAEYGLKYANNEVCYPATLIVGDLVKALVSGRYDLENTAVAITQTGGQCRATNYIALIKKALIDAGYPQVPVLSVAMSGDVTNEQPGFNIPWLKVLPLALGIVFYADCIAQFYYATLAREAVPGVADGLRDYYLTVAQDIIRRNKIGELYELIGIAAKSFNDAAVVDRQLPKVGIVGEIYLKFNSFAHKNVVDYLAHRNIEVKPPLMLGFFMQGFVNRKVRKETHVEKSRMPEFLANAAYALVARKVKQVNRLASQFRHFTPFTDIFEEARHAREIISLSAQFGEGWGLPAEVVSYARNGVNNVISLQPFGCIANHIVSKGVEKKIKELYPQMNLLSLDFDSGVSDVNIANRLLLFTNHFK